MAYLRRVNFNTLSKKDALLNRGGTCVPPASLTNKMLFAPCFAGRMTLSTRPVEDKLFRRLVIVRLCVHGLQTIIENIEMFLRITNEPLTAKKVTLGQFTIVRPLLPLLVHAAKVINQREIDYLPLPPTTIKLLTLDKVVRVVWGIALAAQLG